MQQINQTNIWLCEIFTILSDEIIEQFTQKIVQKYGTNEEKSMDSNLYLKQVGSFAFEITSSQKAEPFQKINTEVFEVITSNTGVNSLNINAFTNISEQIQNINSQCDLLTDFPDLYLLRAYLQIKNLIWGHQYLSHIEIVSCVNSLREISQLTQDEIEIYQFIDGKVETSGESIAYNAIIAENLMLFVNSNRGRILEILKNTEIFANTNLTKQGMGLNLQDQFNAILNEPVKNLEEIGTHANVVSYFRKSTLRHLISTETISAA